METQEESEPQKRGSTESIKNGLERKVAETYEKIPKTTQRDELIAKEKIDQCKIPDI
jgi:hypothetical protein